MESVRSNEKPWPFEKVQKHKKLTNYKTALALATLTFPLKSGCVFMEKKQPRQSIKPSAPSRYETL